MYARPFIHDNNQILLLTDPINSELVYQVWTNLGSICCCILKIVYNVLYTIWHNIPVECITTYINNIPPLWLCIGFIMYNIYLIYLIIQLKAAENDIVVLKINITRITNLFAYRDDHLDDYIKATEQELLNIKKEIYKYKTE
jgi:hypothetical protein